MHVFRWNQFHIFSESGNGNMRTWSYRTGTCERCLQGHTGTVYYKER